MCARVLEAPADYVLFDQTVVVGETPFVVTIPTTGGLALSSTFPSRSTSRYFPYGFTTIPYLPW